MLLLLAGVGVRWREHAQARRLIAGEQAALATFASLHRASQAAVRKGPHPGLAALLAEHPQLHMLEEVSTPEQQYAADQVYVYGLAPDSHRNADGTNVYGYVLRAWPLRFGETGDAEFQINERGGFYRGQNDVGRSGLDEGFPPAFPQPHVAEGLRAAWWQTHLPDGPHK